MSKERNTFVDIMRGIAILLVVLGHTMTGSTTGSENTFIFNVVWSLQMPLFILISGYVTRYSRGIENSSGLWKYIMRRTLAYMLPWAVWTFAVRGFIFGQHQFFDIKWLLWNMDSGYWFLVTIWTISIVFGVSVFIAGKIVENSGLFRQILTLVFYISGMVLLVGIGILAGVNFFTIKLTLYYMPFYFAGYLYGQYADKIIEMKYGKKTVDIAVVLCLAAWLFIILRYNIYELSDGGMAVLLRAVSSITGCIAVCGLCKGVFAETSKIMRVGVILCWCGVHSLEIYLVHYLLLNILKTADILTAGSVKGAVLISANYVITLVLVFLAVRLLNANKVSKLIFFGNSRS